jgi:hypothetical protein
VVTAFKTFSSVSRCPRAFQVPSMHQYGGNSDIMNYLQ